ncbi:methionyl-tRNA formyltransferase [Mycoplasma phocimorsus]|uniref:methionyl-tRNA formyltransferase n=1 Tax=Mycoplasma phocimorsus TaxID=3045839 RepID=A0AAJ1PR95_9MOLU|nr:methionyl-tRNA formyltransferase [Mycoplasma phocimorsus]MDJ1645872.1 methionyl-tRNA formyltransferase [Mycoplasma phocimorsus]MDJ1647479.1 methionyl-tRNA formyltransferase [Mycoplasma phocimorsus]MDJ1648747.1 methionyl-tRNA formyltransferase [Mycoplasma phocimorsus]
MKVVLCGTPSFAVPVFEEINNNINVIAIITQPDTPSNRGQKLNESAVATWAKEKGIKLFKPNKIGEIYEELKELDYDIMLTFAFGQYIPEKVLELPKIASVNIHGSLLPKYRGASPVQYTLLNNDEYAGINLIYMTKDMDAGDIIFEAKLKIQEEDTTSKLFVKLANLAKENIVEWLNKLYKNDIVITKQDETLVTLTKKLQKENGELSQCDDIQTNLNKIRAYADNPGAFYFNNGKRVKVFMAKKEIIKNAPIIPCANGNLYATDYQFESKKRIKL